MGNNALEQHRKCMKKIKRFIHSVRDWGRQWIQIVSLVAIVVYVLLFDASGKILNLLQATNVEVEDLAVEYRISLGIGNPGLALILFIILLLFIRKCNKGYVLKQNTKLIAWHTFFGYWFCCRILNYRIVSLTRVPIPVQMKIVFYDLFDEYRFMDGVTEQKDKENAEIKPLQDYDDPSVVNILLADTYRIDNWQTRMPAAERLHHTIIVDRTNEKRGRYYSAEYVEKIWEAVRSLPDTVKTINIFATINSAHCFHITRDVFMTGGSDRFELLRVYEQNKQTKKFDGENRKIRLK